MNDEQFWNERAKELRWFKGFGPFTLEEAEEALKKATRRRASGDEIESIVDAVSRGELPEVEDQPAVDWSPEYDYNEMEREVVLFRNEGEDNNEADTVEDELLEELLDDDEPKDDADDLED